MPFIAGPRAGLLRFADRKWGQAYLTREFFHQLGETMPEHVLLVVAKEAASDDIVAGALNLIGSEVRCQETGLQGCSPSHRIAFQSENILRFCPAILFIG